MKRLALAAIAFYRRHLSRLKGFSCAFRVYTGRDSCSAYGQRVIARHGLVLGLILLNRRMNACGEKHRQHRPPAMRAMSARHRAQAGFCDLSCDLPDLSCAGDACDVASCAGDIANCDTRGCGDRWRGRKNKDPYVRVNPTQGLE
ncbi:membrane protein insertion efficiency factor YidD [Rugamonas sp. A1-17]|nr:membrane protein insertion efficiency factor YidD [Rugamonas sp. A1-17]